MYKKTLITLILVFLVADASGLAVENSNKWYSFDEGLKQAQKEKKPVMIDFYADWCHWCKVMDKKTFSEKTVTDYLRKNFISIKLETENRNDSNHFKGNTYSSAQLTKAFRVTALPTIAFLDKNQDPVTIFPGYIPPETFISFLKYIYKECYLNKISFEEFMKNGCE